MLDVPVNYLAVLACGVVSMALGSLWYGPLFGKPWMKLMGFTKPDTMDAKAKKMMTRAYGLMFIGSLVTAYILSVIISFAYVFFGAVGGGMTDLGIKTAFLVWLGFVAPVTMGNVLWEGKPWKLWMINNGYNLVFLILSGIILALWV